MKDESAYVKGDLTPEDLGNLEISNSLVMITRCLIYWSFVLLIYIYTADAKTI